MICRKKAPAICGGQGSEICGGQGSGICGRHIMILSSRRGCLESEVEVRFAASRMWGDEKGKGGRLYL